MEARQNTLAIGLLVQKRVNTNSRFATILRTIAASCFLSVGVTPTTFSTMLSSA
eukprot:CAMPEP_0168447660 /NCGR_PEP_ID=MMETSP0228-20121227/46700_1 /TAXON_ID=133427 /ORGANISM="Protoceratium reticulatum, Strain CCCM 535 (=CCMP 1889)" /LENGTH=53 /DNA_ID=CAMNT_0008462183 /DNA_START=243 /DNA_END=404 /DNA_ORIENTATION=+